MAQASPSSALTEAQAGKEAVLADDSQRAKWMRDKYAAMQRIRRFEDTVYTMFRRGTLQGTAHMAAGQEAVAVGARAALNADDYVFSTYRCHHHVIAAGVSVERCFAELLARDTGLCGGKGGSMHLTSVEHKVMGSYAIVGSQLPIACGAAWSCKVRGTGGVAVAFLGDGATNTGAFHEAMNLAAVWDLPAVFICENNLYSEFTPIRSMVTVEHPAVDRAPAYAMKAAIVDGNDVEAVHDTVAEAVAGARDQAGPTMIEAKTYRHYGHSRIDPSDYRPDEEEQAWHERDPLKLARAWLLELGVAQEDIDETDEQIADEIDGALEAARQAPEPGLDAAFTDVYADGGAQWLR